MMIQGLSLEIVISILNSVVHLMIKTVDLSDVFHIPKDGVTLITDGDDIESSKEEKI